MIRQLLIGGTIAAAAGYSVPGVSGMLDFGSSSSFSSSGAKWQSAKSSIGNVSFTSAFGSPRINRGSAGNGNSLTAIVEASQAELARKKPASGAKFIKN